MVTGYNKNGPLPITNPMESYTSWRVLFHCDNQAIVHLWNLSRLSFLLQPNTTSMSQLHTSMVQTILLLRFLRLAPQADPRPSLFATRRATDLVDFARKTWDQIQAGIRSFKASATTSRGTLRYFLAEKSETLSWSTISVAIRMYHLEHGYPDPTHNERIRPDNQSQPANYIPLSTFTDDYKHSPWPSTESASTLPHLSGPRSPLPCERAKFLLATHHRFGKIQFSSPALLCVPTSGIGPRHRPLPSQMALASQLYTTMHADLNPSLYSSHSGAAAATGLPDHLIQKLGR